MFEKKIKLYYCIATLTLSGIFCFPSTTFAQRNFSLGPVIFDKGTVQPGDSFDEIIYIQNEAPFPRLTNIVVRDVVPDDEQGGYSPLEAALSPKISLKQWIILESTSMMIPSTKDIPWLEYHFSIKIPANALPGAHYGVIYFQPEGIDDGKLLTSGAKILQEHGVAVLVNVAGAVKEDGEITDFSIENIYSEIGPVKFKTKITNTGTTYLKPKGNIIISSLWGGVVSVLPFNPSEKRAMPESTRLIETYWDKVVFKVNQTGGIRMQWENFPQLGIGIYRAKANVVIGAEKEKEISSPSVLFVVFPLRLVLFIAIGISALWLFFYRKNQIVFSIQHSHKKTKKGK